MRGIAVLSANNVHQFKPITEPYTRSDDSRLDTGCTTCRWAAGSLQRQSRGVNSHLKGGDSQAASRLKKVVGDG